MPIRQGGRPPIFHFVMIKPSHYDDDGYVIQWMRSAIPSNSLAALYGLALDCAERRVLGADIEIRLSARDETNSRIRPQRIARHIQRDGGRGLIGLVGVQSNQFPRAMDLARQFRALGLQVCIGGFHVCGSIAMLPELTPELREAIDLGVSLYAGEAEGRLEDLLSDAFHGRLKPIYNYMADLPGINQVPTPILPAKRIRRTSGAITSFDAGRGCPFQCSFCTIINVQGRKSRHRDADDIERIVRENIAQGIDGFFISDDNFARNRNWEGIFDRLTELREKAGIKVRFTIQVDTLCHKIPNFIEKAGRAGVARVFIGLENINPDSLMGVKKRQNRITEYRKMLQAWRKIRAITYAGYIIGFPADTRESIVRDIKIIQRELPVDMLEFFYLTPLPGSEDHKNLVQRSVWIDPDLNKYDLHHVTTGHPLMSPEEWHSVYRLAWQTYYSHDHIVTILKRARASRMSIGKVLFMILWFVGCITLEDVHPLEGGWLRRKYRRDRRPGLPIEKPAVFYPRYLWGLGRKYAVFLRLCWRYNQVRRAIKADPNAFDYRDLSLEPVSDDEIEAFDLYSATEAAKGAVAKTRKQEAARLQHAG